MRYIICFALLSGCSFYSDSSGAPTKIVLPDDGDAVAHLADAAAEDLDGETSIQEDATSASSGSSKGDSGSGGNEEPDDGGGATDGMGPDRDNDASGPLAGTGADAATDAGTVAWAFEGHNDGVGLFCDPCESDADCAAGMLCLAQTLCVARKPINGTCFDVCPQTPSSSVSNDASGAFCGPQGGGFTKTDCDLGQDGHGRCEL